MSGKDSNQDPIVIVGAKRTPMGGFQGDFANVTAAELGAASIAGAIQGGTAEFGPPVTTTPVSGNLVQALDPATGTEPSTTDACSALLNAGDVNGNVALIDRGECDFTVKVLAAILLIVSVQMLSHQIDSLDNKRLASRRKLVKTHSFVFLLDLLIIIGGSATEIYGLKSVDKDPN